MDVRHKKKEWKAEIMKWTKSDLAERLMLAYVTIQNLEEKQDKTTGGAEIDRLRAENERLKIDCENHKRVRENHVQANHAAQEECAQLRAENERLEDELRALRQPDRAAMYIEGGVYSYDDGETLVLFSQGHFLMFGWDVEMTISDKDSSSCIDSGRIGRLVATLPLSSPNA